MMIRNSNNINFFESPQLRHFDIRNFIEPTLKQQIQVKQKQEVVFYSQAQSLQQEISKKQQKQLPKPQNKGFFQPQINSSEVLICQTNQKNHQNQQYLLDDQLLKTPEQASKMILLDSTSCKTRHLDETLKKISTKLKQIMIDKQHISIKVLRQKLFDMLRVDGSMQTKKVKNINRRLYDTINVFMASGLLKKNSLRKGLRPTKKMKKDFAMKNLQYQEANGPKKYLQRLKKLCSKRKTNIKRKSQIVINLYKKVANMTVLINRNKQNPSKHLQNIQMPFLVLEAFSNKIVDLDEQHKILQISFADKQQYHILGDTDILNQMSQVENKNKIMIDENPNK